MPPPVVVTGPGNGPATFAQEDFNLFTASMMTGPVDIFGGPTTFGGPGGPAPGGPGGLGFGPGPGGPGGFGPPPPPAFGIDPFAAGEFEVFGRGGADLIEGQDIVFEIPDDFIDPFAFGGPADPFAGGPGGPGGPGPGGPGGDPGGPGN